MQHTVNIDNGLLTYSSVDAIFRLPTKEPVAMEFHYFCGPMFMLKSDVEYYPEEDDPIWEQFYGWFEAVGKEKYKHYFENYTEAALEPTAEEFTTK